MKKIIIIWANCQGGVINLMLNRYYSSEYIIYNYANYEYIKNNIELPQYFYECDIFLYQNYSDRDDDYSLNNIINNIIKKTAIKISFPTLHRNYLQFPYDVNSPENIVTKEKPHGDFFFGIKPIRELVNQLKLNKIEETEIIKTVLYKIYDNNFIPVEKIIEFENITLEFLKMKILNSDIPNIYNFIIDNYKKERLYHNPNHPNGKLLNELCKEIFIKMNLNYPNEKENIILLENLLADWKMPIFNSVINYYNMTNIDNNCLSLWHTDITNFETYVIKYITFLI